MTILRKASEIAEASMADLVETYNAFSETPVKRFSDRTVAMRRTEMAILSGTDRAAHAGVKPGAAIVPMTIAEDKKRPEVDHSAANARIGAMLAQEAAEAQNAVHETRAADPKANPYPAGSKRAALWEKAEKSAKPAVRPVAPKREKGEGRAPKVFAVELTHAGVSKMQPGSARFAVFQAIESLAAKSGGQVNVEELEKYVGIPVRGHIQKLMVVNHVRAV